MGEHRTLHKKMLPLTGTSNRSTKTWALHSNTGHGELRGQTSMDRNMVLNICTYELATKFLYHLLQLMKDGSMFGQIDWENTGGFHLNLWRRETDVHSARGMQCHHSSLKQQQMIDLRKGIKKDQALPSNKRRLERDCRLKCTRHGSEIMHLQADDHQLMSPSREDKMDGCMFGQIE